MLGCKHYLIYNFNLWKTLQKVQCKTLIANFKWYFASFPREDFIIFYLIGKEVYRASSNCRRPWGRFRAGGGITYLIWPGNLFRSPRIRPCREADPDNQKKIDKLIDIKTFISRVFHWCAAFIWRDKPGGLFEDFQIQCALQLTTLG